MEKCPKATEITQRPHKEDDKALRWQEYWAAAGLERHQPEQTIRKHKTSIWGFEVEWRKKE